MSNPNIYLIFCLKCEYMWHSDLVSEACPMCGSTQTFPQIDLDIYEPTEPDPLDDEEDD